MTTPTEAAALAAAYAFLLATFFYRALTWKSLYRVLSESARATASIGIVIGGALIFNYIVAAENIPQTMAGLLAQQHLPPQAFLFMIKSSCCCSVASSTPGPSFW